MKKIIFFDLDNTIHSTQKKEIPSGTRKLLEKLASTPNVEIGLATGRGPSKVHLLGDLLDLFTYKIFINGSVAYHNNELVYKNPIEVSEIEKVLKLAVPANVSVGFVAEKKEYVNEHSKDVDYGMKDFQQMFPETDPNAYLKMPVYQLWLFSQNRQTINDIVKEVDLVCYPWHNGGADLVDKSTNKALAIQNVLKDQKDYQLITIGDGHNDIEMIKLADIGIAMGNTGFDELKKKADHVAPHIDDNQLYEFFKELKIID